MNNGAFGENFPYSNFHDLNMDWIIKIAKDFLDQYTHIQETISAGEESLTNLTTSGLEQLQNLTTSGLEQLQNKADTLEALLQQWYDTHSQDIANQLAQALLDFGTQASIKAQETLESIPDNYTVMGNNVTFLLHNIVNTNAYLEAIRNTGTFTLQTKGMKYLDYYMPRDGSLQPGVTHKLFEIKDPTISSITFPAFTQLSASPTVILKLLNNVVARFDWTGETAHTVEIPNINYDTIYINYWYGGTANPAYSQITFTTKFCRNNINSFFRTGNVVKSLSDNLGNTIQLDFKNNPSIESGYLTGQPNYASSGQTYSHIFLPAEYIRKIEIHNTTAPAAPLVYWYPDNVVTPNTLIGGVVDGIFTAEYPLKGIIGINIFTSPDGIYADYATIELFDHKTAHHYDPYDHVVRSKLDFKNKTGIFCGDSITVGMTSSTTQTENTYPKLFSTVVQMTYTNVAVAGATITPNVLNIKSVTEQVEEIVTPPDFLFIAGGINDWQVGVPMVTFKEAVTSLINYINTNMPNTTIIWILPISEAGWSLIAYHNLYDAQEYRNALYQQIMKGYTYRHYIVDGMKFGFPNKYSDPTYISAMLPDKLHPSEQGYHKLYTTGLLNALKVLPLN